MANQIACTFEGCYQRFPSVEAMKKHKAKMKDNSNDEIHDFYCRKCDEDCADDTEFLIHQISSQKHIVCPACGVEFKSEGGRDRHVGITHRQKQRLKCPGCTEIFTDATGLMTHIEKNQCRVIKCDDFYRHRAEQQIERDVMNGLSSITYTGNTAMFSSADSDPHHGGTSLVLDEKARLPQDWNEPSRQLSDPFGSTTSSMSQALSDLAIDKYPPLHPHEKSTETTSFYSSRRRQPEVDSDSEPGSTTTNDLLDMPEEPQVQHGMSSAGQPSLWGENKASRAQRRLPTTFPNSLDSDSSMKLPYSRVVDNGSWATHGTNASEIQRRSDPPFPAPKPENSDPNAAYAHIQTRPHMRTPTRETLQKYWNSVLGCYICPGDRCGRRLMSPAEFEQHLVSGVHSDSTVQCPSCLKRFKTTRALVAHAESGSTKCDLRNTEDFDLAIREMTGGLVKVSGTWDGAGNAKFESVPIGEW